MCGIAGVISPRPLSDDAIAIVRTMTGRLTHRGPDSDGFFIDRHVALGMRRLSIIDLAGGHQPIFNEERDVAIVCNGEIYNHRALRDRLARQGHHFRTASDVETIVHDYEERGEACLQDLRGMFAFALWDTGRRTLLLARDRMGEKPLFLHRDGQGRLWFASELRALIVALGPGRPALSADAINLFLTFQYVPEPATLLEGVSLLPAGHVLALTPETTGAPSRAYWDFMAVPPLAGEPVAAARAAFDEACLLMGSADVPVGVALSGGIDSSLVAAVTARHYPGQVHAFSVGYPGRPETDERSISQRFAKSLGIPFTDVEISADEVVENFPALIWEMDVPVADIAAYGYYAVSRAARNAGVPVLLSGLGGDEMFWGYDWVRNAVGRNQGVPTGSGARAWLARLFGSPRQTGERTFYEVHDELRNSDRWSRDLMPHGAPTIPDGLWLRRAQLGDGARVDMEVSDLLNRTWLRSNCLALADRVSMAHSVEMRLPFLDPVLVERVTALRVAGLDDWRKPHKWLILAAFGDLLPPEIVNRSKQGFTPPVRHWLDQVCARYAPLLRDGALIRAGLFDRAKLAAVLPQASQSFVYKATLLEIWARLILDGVAPAEIGLAADDAMRVALTAAQ